MSGNFNNNRGGGRGGSSNPPAPKTILNDWDLRLVLPAQNGGREPSLQFGLSNTKYGLKPKLVLRTQVQGAKDDGVVTVAYSVDNFFVFMNALRDALDGKLEAGKAFVIENTKFFSGKHNVVSKTMIGCEQDGRLYMAVLAAGHANMKFYFGPRDPSNLRYQDGSEIPVAMTSRWFGNVFARNLSAMMANILVTKFVDTSPGGGGGGGGNFNNNGGGNGGGGGGGNNWGGNSGGGGGGAAPAASSDFGDEFPDNF